MPNGKDPKNINSQHIYQVLVKGILEYAVQGVTRLFGHLFRHNYSHRQDIRIGIEYISRSNQSLTENIRKI